MKNIDKRFKDFVSSEPGKYLIREAIFAALINGKRMSKKDFNEAIDTGIKLNTFAENSLLMIKANYMGQKFFVSRFERKLKRKKGIMLNEIPETVGLPEDRCKKIVRKLLENKIIYSTKKGRKNQYHLVKGKRLCGIGKNSIK